jgi:beta-phosphoglucomutase-like phosphatase (HAD superfamily)
MAMRAAVFDFDGVLVDSEPFHFRALRDALRADGVEITEEEYWQRYLAYDNRRALRLALEQHDEAADPERIERLNDRAIVRFEALVPEIPLFPGAAGLVHALAEEIPLAIASGARGHEVEAVLREVGLRDAFTAIVAIEDTPRGKPDPAPYLEAATRLAARMPEISPAECVALEDSAPGVASALAAGMKVVGVTHSYAVEKLQAAHRVVGSLVGLDAAGLRGLFEE